MKPRNPNLTSKDVMINNYLKTSDGKIVQVTKINNDSFACDFPHLWDYNNKFFPIEIKDVLSDIKDNDILKLLEKIDIKYVHELQILVKVLPNFKPKEIKL